VVLVCALCDVSEPFTTRFLMLSWRHFNRHLSQPTWLNQWTLNCVQGNLWRLLKWNC